MTQIFLRFYVGVLIVLLVAWFIYGFIYEQRTDADVQRVILQAHRGGLAAVIEKLEQNEWDLRSLQRQFDYPVTIQPLDSYAASIQRQLNASEEAMVIRIDGRWRILRRYPERSLVIGMGPFPDYDLVEIEHAIRGWVRLVRADVAAASKADRPDVISEIQREFAFPIQEIRSNSLPDRVQRRLVSDTKDVVFYAREIDEWYAAIAIASPDDEDRALRFGPFPNFQPKEQQAATTTLTLVLLPAAFAIALLLRPIAVQLRTVEKAASAVASGDFSARVDERRNRSARSLSIAFNGMAQRIEKLIESQRNLLQAVSHELRTPLARMRFSIDAIQSNRDEEQRPQKLLTLDRDAEELNSLLTELLNYTRLEDEGSASPSEVLTLGQLVADLIPKYEAIYPDIQYEYNVSDIPEDDQIYAPRILVERAVGNVLSNGGKYAQKHVQVSFQLTPDSLVLNIDDDGPGIPIEDRDRVFSPFVRLQTREPAQGFGLGLALVHRILKQQGGEAAIEDSVLGGCRVSLNWSRRSDTRESHGRRRT
ncbi:MAG: ATP-binding protein [Planctomycetota bacterium]|nr:ATP-binding protein [Planctomycetota bacterium]